MQPRITINMTSDGELEIWVNPLGRDLLVKELLNLNERNDHFHLGSWEGSEVMISSRSYRPNDTLINGGKVLFRTDEWDKKYYPHVINDPN